MFNRTLICICALLLSVSCKKIEIADDSSKGTSVVIKKNEEAITKITEQNKWIYEQMSRHYFWRDDLPDTSGIDWTVASPTFFKSLLSSEDRFSWCEANKNYTKSYDDGFELGFEYQPVRLSSGQSVNRVLMVTDPVLKSQGLQRGDYVSLPDGLLSKSICKYSLLDGKLTEPTDIVINSEITKTVNIAPSIPLDTIYNIGGRNIAYVIYEEFGEEADVRSMIYDLMERNVQDLILDLRYNYGGYVRTCNTIASYFINAQYLGSLFQIQHYNQIISSEQSSPENPDGLNYVYLNSSDYVKKRTLNLNRLVVLTTKNSASASEALILCMRPYIPVYIVGTTTTGKDVGSYTIADDKYEYQLQPITFRYYNAVRDSVPVTGLVPDVVIQDDLNHERGDLNEALLAGAVEFLTGISVSESDPAICDVYSGPSSIEQKRTF